MKKTIGILLGCLCILLLESGVKRIEKKPALTITPSRLQLFVDQHTDPYTIKIVYTLNIPHGFIPSCARMVYQPYFLSAGHRYDLTPLVVSGKNNLRQEKRLTALTDKQPDYPEALRLISEGEGMQVRLSETVPFELWMAQAKLRADVTLEACGRWSDLVAYGAGTGSGEVRKRKSDGTKSIGIRIFLSFRTIYLQPGI